MTNHDRDPELVSRREVLQTAAAIAPLPLGGRAVSRLLQPSPVLEPDAPPGKDSELLGIGIAIEEILGPIPGPRFR